MSIGQRLVASTRYLKEHGLTQPQLTALHHFSAHGKPVTYEAVERFLGSKSKLHAMNVDFARRVEYVASKHRERRCSFHFLVLQALRKWPLEMCGQA